MSELESQVDAAYAIEKARSEAIRRCAEIYGEQATYLIWRLGYVVGMREGVKKVQEILG
jgi:hypothetical protein